MWRKYLGREPGALYVQHTLNTFAYAGVTQESFEAAILGCPEYLALHGNTTRGFVRAMLAAVMGSSSAGEQTLYEIFAVMGSREGAAMSALTSLKGREQRVTGYYRHFLGREPEPGALEYWVPRTNPAAYKLEELVADFVCCPEFYDRVRNGDARFP